MTYTPEWFTYFAIFFLVVGGTSIAVIGWFDGGKSLIKKAPWLEKLLSRTGSLEILLLGVIVFLIIDGIRLYQIQIPSPAPLVINILPPLPPVLPTPIAPPVKGKKEPTNSIAGPVEQGPCSSIQQGGSQNQTNIQCGPPPLELTVTPMGPQEPNVPGKIRVGFRVTPNQHVNAPFRIYMDFDKPVDDLGCFVPNVGANMGGGAFRHGLHTYVTCGTGFGPETPLTVTVISTEPVNLVGTPTIQ
jgi:hypothetical protein